MYHNVSRAHGGIDPLAQRYRIWLLSRPYLLSVEQQRNIFQVGFQHHNRHKCRLDPGRLSLALNTPLFWPVRRQARCRDHPLSATCHILFDLIPDLLRVLCVALTSFSYA